MEPLVAARTHAVCIPFPVQSHINAMLQLAKLLHSRGFFITFINTEFNHRRILRSNGLDSLKGSIRFQFKTIPDGLPQSDGDETQDLRKLCVSTQTNCLTPFRDRVIELNQSTVAPKVTCIVSDGIMSFTLQIAEESGIPGVIFWPISACGLMGLLQYPELVEKGVTPLRDESYFTNGYLDATIDWIPGMRDLRLKDLPSFIQTTDPNDIFFNFFVTETPRIYKASGLILNTLEDLEHEVVDALRSTIPNVCTVGPLSLICSQMSDKWLKLPKPNLWKEERECLTWLDKWDARSVVYANFGSLTVVTSQQLNEFAWGLANSKHPFLWIVRPDVVMNDKAILPDDFIAEIQGRGLIVSWCPQEEVLLHPSIGAFLTHCGWNSMMESICGGVPMICWPFFADQPTNCRYACKEWGIGVEIDNDVKREKISNVVQDLMEGEKGKEMRRKAMKWKESAENAAAPGGSSHTNLDRLIHDVLRIRN